MFCKDIIKIIIKYASFEQRNWFLLRLLNKEYYEYSKQIQDICIDDTSDWTKRVTSPQSLKYMVNRDKFWIINNPDISINIAVKYNLIEVGAEAIPFISWKSYERHLFDITANDDVEKLKWFIEYGNLYWFTVGEYDSCVNRCIYKKSVKCFNVLVNDKRYIKEHKISLIDSFGQLISDIEDLKMFIFCFNDKTHSFLIHEWLFKIAKLIQDDDKENLKLIFKHFALSRTVTNKLMNKYGIDWKTVEKCLEFK